MAASGTRSRASGQRIDELMTRATEALGATSYFECERLAAKALDHAHNASDYERMARILLPLEEARRQRRMLAQDAGEVVVVNDYPLLEALMEGDEEPAPGMYLVECPLVGADGRNLRERLYRDDIPALVLVREPETRLGLWPLVMIGPITVRAYVRPPKGGTPGVAWMLDAGEALGDAAIASVDAGAEPRVQVDHLYDRLQTVIDHDRLHQALLQTCEQAARADADDES